MVGDLAATQAAEKVLRAVLVRAHAAVSFLVVDALDDVSALQPIPRNGFVGDNLRTPGGARSDNRHRGGFGLERLGDRPPVALANDDDGFALAALVDGKATVAPVLGAIGGLHAAAEVSATNLSTRPRPRRERPSFRTRRHREFCAQGRKMSATCSTSRNHGHRPMGRQ